MSADREWDVMFSINDAKLRWLIERLEADCVDRLPSVKPLRILDLGCGSGEEVFALAERFPHAEVVGIDISEPNIAAGHREVERRGLQDRVSFHCGDYRELPFPAGHFHLAIAENVLHLIRDDDHSLLKKIVAELASGGQFAFSIPYPGPYNAVLTAIRSSLRMVRSRWTDRLILECSRRLHRRDVELSYLQERVHYMYLTPTCWHSRRFRSLMQSWKLTPTCEHPYPHGSPAQMRCKFWIYQKAACDTTAQRRAA